MRVIGMGVMHVLRVIGLRVITGLVYRGVVLGMTRVAVRQVDS